MNMITIRRYRENDAISVGQFIADTYSRFNLAFATPENINLLLGPFPYARSPESEHRKAIAQAIRAPLVLVAIDGDEIVGVLRGGRKDTKQRTVLQSLFVRGDHHRQGIGRKLVERFERECYLRRATVIRLAATMYAAPFYLSVGYKKSTGVRNGGSFQGVGLQVQPMRKVR
jgi:GNAT superfamily N-acetyltransferase